ncbi:MULTISPECIES: O-antigen ligase family protein [Streptomyces]|uniref:O-antigen ligase family protein n=1 Tax=Streptomyces TaxID=1883 RepID=UPI001E5E3D0E|nr:O-antigen ligase family protein [Streptomyces ruber]
MSAAGAPAAGDRRGAADTAGVVLLGACAAWALVTAAARGGRPEGVLLAVLAVAAGYASGRICGALLPVAAPGAGALAGVSLAVTGPHVGPGQFVAPLGDAGATAALFALSAGAAACAARAARTPALRPALWLLAAGVAVAAGALGSVAGCVLSAGVLLCSLAASRVRRRALGLSVLAVTACLATGVSWAVAEDVLPGGPTTVLEDRLTSQRAALWRAALGMVHREPALGVGPGRFAELTAPAARTLSPAPDGRPHSAPLQQAAEQGLLGAALLGAVFCWLLYALWRSGRSTPLVLTAGAALTALALVATAGNALSFTTVTAAAGLLAGIATARPLDDDGGGRDGGDDGADDTAPPAPPAPSAARPTPSQRAEPCGTDE